MVNMVKNGYLDFDRLCYLKYVYCDLIVLQFNELYKDMLICINFY